MLMHVFPIAATFDYAHGCQSQDGNAGQWECLGFCKKGLLPNYSRTSRIGLAWLLAQTRRRYSCGKVVNTKICEKRSQRPIRPADEIYNVKVFANRKPAQKILFSRGKAVMSKIISHLALLQRTLKPLCVGHFGSCVNDNSSYLGQMRGWV